ncbi:MAG TPA: class I SAM-dependent methyltransferase [Actinomycetota bacterium]
MADSHRTSRSRSFERIADRYDETRGGQERGDRIAAHLGPLLERSWPVLEVGIGTGAVAAGLAKLGFSVIGLDLSPAMAARARDRIGHRVMVADAERIPIAPASISQACAVWVLHVIGDRARHVEEVRRILRPGGRYVVVASNPIDPLGRSLAGLAQRVGPDWNAGHDPAEIQRLGTDSGLRPIRVVDLSPVHFEQSPLAMATAIESRTFSFLWDLDRRSWEEHVAPAVTSLRHMPEPERPVPRTSVDRAVVFERPV